VRAHSHEESRAAFERLFRHTRNDLLAYIVRRAGNSEDAADVLAETYLIAWQKLDAIPAGDRARLWLFGVARKLRRATAMQAPVDTEAADAVRAALAALPERDREILTLTAWDGLTPRQIAAVTGSSANIVRVRLHRARARLKRQLGSVGAAKRRPEPVAVEYDCASE